MSTIPVIYYEDEEIILFDKFKFNQDGKIDVTYDAQRYAADKAMREGYRLRTICCGYRMYIDTDPSKYFPLIAKALISLGYRKLYGQACSGYTLAYAISMFGVICESFSSLRPYNLGKDGYFPNKHGSYIENGIPVEETLIIDDVVAAGISMLWSLDKLYPKLAEQKPIDIFAFAYAECCEDLITSPKLGKAIMVCVKTKI